MKLESLKFRRRSEAGEDFAFVAAVNVDKSGTFTIVIPDQLAPCAAGLLKAKPERDKHEGDLWLEKPRIYSRVCCTRLEVGKRFVEECIDDYVKSDIKRERIIIYGLRTRASYVKHENGKLFPNGGFPGADYPEHSAWSEHSASKSNVFPDELDNYYYLGFVAIVRDRISHVRGSHTTFTLERPAWDHRAYELAGQKLNAFVHLDILPGEMGAFKTLPYTEEAAAFFYDIMMGICALTDKIGAFFADEKHVRAAIENKVQVLALPPAKRAAHGKE